MHIEHIAIWTCRLEAMREFYETWLGAESSPKYVNAAKGFESYFLSFGLGARLELMTMPGLAEESGTPSCGYAHAAFSLGSREAVESLTARLKAAGFAVVGEPRITGDGYFESVVLDPDGNRVEITV